MPRPGILSQDSVDLGQLESLVTSMISVEDPAKPPASVADALALVRRAREVVAHLVKALEAVSAAQARSDDIERKAASAAAHRHLANAYARDAPVVSDLFRRLTCGCDVDPHMNEAIGDEVCRLRNVWLDVVEAWPAKSDDSPRPALDLLDGFVLEAAYITVPDRLLGHLETYRPGQALKFADEFGDELPKPEHQRAILDFLYRHPKSVPGVIDPRKGLVYYADRRLWRRAASMVGVVALAAVGFGLTFLLGRWTDAPGLTKATGHIGVTQLSSAYLLALAGAAGHVVVGALKEIRHSDDEARFVSMENWLLWLHVRELAVGAGVIGVWIATYAAIGASATKPQAVTMLLAGYGADSIVDLLLPKFLGDVDARAAKVAKKIAG
jgi:hypothetical protein